jgi:hypothetical protein
LTTNKKGKKERPQRNERERERIVAMEMRRRERIAVAIAPTFFSHILRETGILAHVAPQGSSILGY